MSRAWKKSLVFTAMPVTALPILRNDWASVRAQYAIEVSYSYMPVSKMPATRKVRIFGRMPPRADGSPWGEITATSSPSQTPRERASSLPISSGGRR